MIFITTGTTKFAFKRLLQNIDNFMQKNNSEEILIIQGGNTKYTFRYKNVKQYKFLDYKKVIDNLSKARLVICHGGFGSVYLSLKYSKNIPVVVPRTFKNKEHVSDHQVDFVKHIALTEKVIAIFPQNNFYNKFSKIFKNPQKNFKSHKHWQKNINKIIRFLTKTTEGF